MVVQANGYLNITHGTGYDNIGIKVTDDPAETIFTYGVSSVTVPAALPTANYRYPFSCLRVFDFDAATDLKVYLIIRQLSGTNIGSTNVAWSYLVATYYPTSYFPVGVSPPATFDVNRPMSTDGFNPNP